MNESNAIELSGREVGRDELTELIRTGARKLISEAVEVELSELLLSYVDWRDEQGRAAVVRNGYQPERKIQTGVGPVTVRVPKVRKAARLEAALPWLYLEGTSTGEMQSALEALMGCEARGLSASTVSRLKRCWGEQYEAWRHRRWDQDGGYISG